MKNRNARTWMAVAAASALPTLLLNGCSGGGNGGGPGVPASEGSALATLDSAALSPSLYAGTYTAKASLGSGKSGTLKVVVSATNTATATFTPGSGPASTLAIAFVASTGTFTLSGNVSLGTQKLPVKLSGEVPTLKRAGFVKGTINGVAVNVTLTKVVVTPTPTPTKAPPPGPLNTVVFSGVASTNATTTPFIPDSRAANPYAPSNPPAISFSLSLSSAGKTRLVSFIVFGPSDGSGVKVGKLYPIAASEQPNGYVSGTYTEGTSQLNQNEWAMTGGSVVIDSISNKVYHIRLINLAMKPAPTGSHATGDFTLNFKGDATSPFL